MFWRNKSIIDYNWKTLFMTKPSFNFSPVCKSKLLNTSTPPEQKHYAAYRKPELKQWGEHSYSTIKELNALNLEPTTSFSLMKAILTNNIPSNYTVDNFKVKKLFWFLKIRAFFKYHCRLDSLFYQCIHFRVYISQFFKSIEFLRTFYYNHYL